MKLKKWVKVTLLIVALGGTATTYVFLANEDKPIKTEEAKEVPAKQIIAEPEKEIPKSPATKENFDKITVGDDVTGKGGSPLQDVLDIMGEQPTDTGESHAGKNTIIKVFTWTGKNAKISVTFVNDSVSEKTWVEVK